MEGSGHSSDDFSSCSRWESCRLCERFVPVCLLSFSLTFSVTGLMSIRTCLHKIHDRFEDWRKFLMFARRPCFPAIQSNQCYTIQYPIPVVSCSSWWNVKRHATTGWWSRLRNYRLRVAVIYEI